MRKVSVKAADLFCGAGGTSTGFIRAMKRLGYEFDLIAINHWALAIATHSLNHPNVRHKDSDLERVNPREVVPSGHLDILWASPECTYYSNALGGKPVNNQSRATPKWVLKWMSILDIDFVAIENVAEFRNWGPVHRCKCGTTDPKKHKKGFNCLRPIENRKGEYFYRFIRKIEALGYKVEYRVLCAADYGAPTSRRRLFILCSKKGNVVWPEPTHDRKGGDMFGKKKPWKTAKDHVIDWSIQGESIFTRQKPLSPNTMKRIMLGLEKFGGKTFIMGNQSGAMPQDVEVSPVPTLTANGSIGMFRPFITTLDQGGSIRDIDRPLHTITSAEATALVEPMLVPFCEPFMVSAEQTGGNGMGVRSVSDPLYTITGSASIGVAEPYIVEYHTNGGAHSIHKPLPTITGSDGFALAYPIVKDHKGNTYLVDIHYRMLRKHEYAKAQGFPRGYKFQGGSKAVMKQIGNAVPPVFAEAITLANMKERI